jgi:uncharacterized protein involved in outer membrane biogenesis
MDDHFGNAGKGDRACNSRWRSLYEGLMRMSMNTRFSGSARIDSTNVLPSGEFRGQTKLIKITEDVQKFAAQQQISEEQALKIGLKEGQKSSHKWRRGLHGNVVIDCGSF